MDIYQCTMFDDVIMIIEKLAIVVNPKKSAKLRKNYIFAKIKGKW